MGRNRIITAAPVHRAAVFLEGEEATKQFAASFAQGLPSRSLLALSGGLGAGKTTFMQGLLRGLGSPEEIVQSPTFTYLHLYPSVPSVFHFDLYRLSSCEDFLALGFDEYFEKEGITAFEWPERIEKILPPHTVHIRLDAVSSDARRLVIT
jgi:tRNA threonylcarbamoyladenosine biosynthesis protein TsaE